MSIGIFVLIVVRMSHRLGDLRTKRTELETQRASVVGQIHQLQTQITARKKEGKKERKFIWKIAQFRKRFMEKEISHWKKSYDFDRRTQTFGIHLMKITSSSFFRSFRKFQRILINNWNKQKYVWIIQLKYEEKNEERWLIDFLFSFDNKRNLNRDYYDKHCMKSVRLWIH